MTSESPEQQLSLQARAAYGCAVARRLAFRFVYAIDYSQYVYTIQYSTVRARPSAMPMDAEPTVGYDGAECGSLGVGVVGCTMRA